MSSIIKQRLSLCQALIRFIVSIVGHGSTWSDFNDIQKQHRPGLILLKPPSIDPLQCSSEIRLRHSRSGAVLSQPVSFSLALPRIYALKCR